MGPGTGYGVYDNNTIKLLISAVECKLHFCVKTYEARVDDGNFVETEIAASHNASRLSNDGQPGLYDIYSLLSIPAGPSCYIDGVEHTPPYESEDLDKCTYVVGGDNAIALVGTLVSDSIFVGEGSSGVSCRSYFSNDVLHAIYGIQNSTSLGQPDTGNYISVNRAFQSLSKRLTDHARSSGEICGDARVTGTQWTDELYLGVRWAWLVPTALLLILALLFFGMTVL